MRILGKDKNSLEQILKLENRISRRNKKIILVWKVNLLGLKQSFLNIKNKDFYYAIGDGNYLFGKVTDVNMILKTFEVVFVFFDEYNW